MIYQFKYKPNPKNIVLDLMGVNKSHSLGIAQLHSISDIFGISINNLRVTLNRLVKAEMLSKDDANIYHLTPKSLDKRKFINRWRASQLKKDSWDGSWIACYLPKGIDRTLRKKSFLALDWYGFKQGLDHVLVRPNNLMLSIEELALSLKTLGLEVGATIFVMSDLDETTHNDWISNLWSITQLDCSYNALTNQLIKSRSALESTSSRSSLVDVCLLGGEAIHYLAIDPLLPDTIRPGKAYETLKNTMIDYDAIARNSWLEKLSCLGVDSDLQITQE